MVRSRLCWGRLVVPSIFAASRVGKASVDCMMTAKLGVDLVGLWEGLFGGTVAVLAVGMIDVIVLGCCCWLWWW